MAGDPDVWQQPMCGSNANNASTWAVVRGDAAVAMLRGHRLPARLVSVDGAVTTAAGWPGGE